MVWRQHRHLIASVVFPALRGGGEAVPPTAENQTAIVGALDLASFDGYQIVDSNGDPITGASITGGTATDVSVSAGGLLTCDADGDFAGQDGATVIIDSDLGPATITLDVLPDTYMPGNNTEVSAVLAISTATVAGKTIKLRTGVTYTRISITNKAYGSVVTLTSEEGAVIAGVTVQNSTNVTVSGNLIRADAADNLHLVYVLGLADNVIVTNNEICTTTPVDPNADFSAGWFTALNGVRTADSSGLPVNLTVTGNNIHDVRVGVNVAPTGDLVVTDNEIYRCYEDGVKVSPGPTSTTINWNKIHHQFGRGSDTGNPHCDPIQLSATSAVADWTGIEIIGNRIWRGNARGDLQGIFMDDLTVGLFFTAHIASNFISGTLANGIKINRAKDCLIQNNTVVGPSDNPYGGSARSATVSMFIGSDETSGTNIVLDNIAEAITISGTNQDNNNILLGQEVASPYTDYTAAFDGTTFDPDTISDVMTLFNMKAAGSADGTFNAGAIGTGYSDFTAKTYTAPRSSYSSGYTPNYVDNGGTAHFTRTGGPSNDAQGTWYFLFKPNTVASGTQNIYVSSGRSIFSRTTAKMRLVIKDSANTTVYDATTTNDVFAAGVEVEVYIAVDLSAPSIVIRVDGVDLVASGAMSVATSLAAGNGLIAHSRDQGILALSTGTSILNCEIAQYWFDPTQVVAYSSFNDGSDPLDLTSVGSPYVWFGDDQTADERGGNTSQGWNDTYNLGSATSLALSGTFTDA